MPVRYKKDNYLFIVTKVISWKILVIFIVGGGGGDGEVGLIVIMMSGQL